MVRNAGIILRDEILPSIAKEKISKTCIFLCVTHRAGLIAHAIDSLSTPKNLRLHDATLHAGCVPPGSMKFHAICFRALRWSGCSWSAAHPERSSGISDPRRMCGGGGGSSDGSMYVTVRQHLLLFLVPLASVVHAVHLWPCGVDWDSRLTM